MPPAAIPPAVVSPTATQSSSPLVPRTGRFLNSELQNVPAIAALVEDIIDIGPHFLDPNVRNMIKWVSDHQALDKEKADHHPPGILRAVLSAIRPDLAIPTNATTIIVANTDNSTTATVPAPEPLDPVALQESLEVYLKAIIDQVSHFQVWPAWTSLGDDLGRFFELWRLRRSSMSEPEKAGHAESKGTWGWRRAAPGIEEEEERSGGVNPLRRADAEELGRAVAAAVAAASGEGATDDATPLASRGTTAASLRAGNETLHERFIPAVSAFGISLLALIGSVAVTSYTIQRAKDHVTSHAFDTWEPTKRDLARRDGPPQLALAGADDLVADARLADQTGSSAAADFAPPFRAPAPAAAAAAMAVEPRAQVGDDLRDAIPLLVLGGLIVLAVLAMCVCNRLRGPFGGKFTRGMEGKGRRRWGQRGYMRTSEGFEMGPVARSAV